MLIPAACCLLLAAACWLLLLLLALLLLARMLLLLLLESLGTPLESVGSPEVRRSVFEPGTLELERVAGLRKRGRPRQTWGAFSVDQLTK